MENVNVILFDLIQDYLPEDWEKVVYWALYTDNSYTMKYFVKVNDKYIDCFDLYSEDILFKLFKNLNNIIQECKNKNSKENWTSLILSVDTNGKFKTDYGYENISDNSIEVENNIKSKYLN